MGFLPICLTMILPYVLCPSVLTLQQSNTVAQNSTVCCLLSGWQVSQDHNRNWRDCLAPMMALVAFSTSRT